MKQIKFVEQMEKNECGLACLTMLFNYNGFNISLIELREEFPSPQSGVSFYHMKEICNYYSFQAEPYRISRNKIKGLENNSIPLPAIIQWNEGAHFVVLEKLTKSYVDIVDPSLGSLRVDREDFHKLFTGNILYISQETNDFTVLKKKTNFKSKLLKGVLYSNLKVLTVIFIASLVLQLFNAIPALMIGDMVDQLTNNNVLNDNLLILLAIISIPLFSFILLFFRGYLLIIMQNSIDFSIITRYFKHFLKLPATFFEKRQQGDLIYRANLLTNIRDIISNHLLGILLNISLIVVYSVFMIQISVELGILVITYGFIITLILMLFTRLMYNLSKKVLLKETEMQEFMAETINNIFDIKSFAIENKTYSTWEKIFLKYLKYIKQHGTLNVGIDSFTSSLRLIQGVVIFFYGSRLVEDNILTLGMLTSFIFFAESFITPIFSSSQSYFSLVQISSIFQRIQDVFDNNSEQGKLTNNISANNLKGKIEFKNVSFRFNQFESYILKDVSFVINPGEKVLLKGESGTGKSTIIKLILGIYKANKGEIFIDGEPIESYDLSSLRTSISSILQESRLFNKSLSENITMFKDEPKSLEFYEAIYSSNLQEVINSLDAKEQTMVSENGTNFSGGQRQRILLARAIYKKANLFLLDEATNALDQNNESTILDSLLSKNITLLMISHNPHTIQSFDKELLLIDQKIKELSYKGIN